MVSAEILLQYYKAYLDYMDPNVWYLSNADKLDHSIAPADRH